MIKFLLLFFTLNCYSSNFVIIHSKEIKSSREFVEANKLLGYKVIDFYDHENEETKSFKKLGIQISDFPTIVDIDTGLQSITPQTMNDGILAIKVSEKFKIDQLVYQMKLGQEVIAIMRLYKDQKNFDKTKNKEFNTKLEDFASLLSEGKITKALAEIEAFTDPIIDADFKEKLIGRLKTYIKAGYE